MLINKNEDGTASIELESAKEVKQLAAIAFFDWDSKGLGKLAQRIFEELGGFGDETVMSYINKREIDTPAVSM